MKGDVHPRLYVFPALSGEYHKTQSVLLLATIPVLSSIILQCNVLILVSRVMLSCVIDV